MRNAKQELYYWVKLKVKKKGNEAHQLIKQHL